VRTDETKPDISKNGNSGKGFNDHNVIQPETDPGNVLSDVKKEIKDALLTVLSQLMTSKKRIVATKVTSNYAKKCNCHKYFTF
jgi:hypothetical protein